ncbi:hypothetical protein [Trichocoleus sp. FACHB-262]|uniref:hypothetical protein n=1 Tax=Trichocoleus sp. FACHB-262 TaxID=2692869 RepID=UPI0016886CB5|nr:hypothetical protein [Trichocoleus sp. FACHB-262]MBD2120556.1 hypothetical protein [Trichocoleus sp. FACHB-262]
MVGQVARSPLTFDQFVNQYPEDGGRYELRRVELDGGSGVCSGTVGVILVESTKNVSTRLKSSATK